MKRRNKILIAAAFVLVLGFVLKPSGSYRRAVEAYKNELRAKGEKLTIAEFVPSFTPDASNAATLFLKAINTSTAPSLGPSTMSLIGPGVAKIGHANVEPALMASYESNTLKMWELRNALQASILDFNLDYSKGVLLLPLPHLGKLRPAATLASDTATQAMYRGDFEEARLDLLAGADLVRIFCNEPVMVSDMVRITLATIAVRAAWDVLQSRRWTEPQLAELQAKWEAIDFIRNQETVLAIERADVIYLLATLRKARDGGASDQLTVGTATGSSGSADGFLRALMKKTKEVYDRYPGFWAWKSRWSYDEELFALRMNAAAMQAARRYKETEAVVPVVAAFKQEVTGITNLHPNARKHIARVAQYSSSTYENYFLNLARADTARRLLVTAIALKRHHLRHNSYPSNLSGLVPAFLQRIPNDPMDGKPLRYQLKPDGNFLLYSVGEDGEDNGGDAAATASRVWLRRRDIVWPRAATPDEVEQFNQSQKKSTNGPGNTVQIRE